MLSLPFSIQAEAPLPPAMNVLVENTSNHPIRNVWFYREDMPNFYSSATIVESVTAGKETETEKVLALFNLFPKYYYNYYPISEGGLLFDPPTLFAVLGSAQCNYASAVLQTLCQLVGCETRTIGVESPDVAPRIAHCTMEVRADGRWIYMDPDGHAIYRRADGELASVADLVADAAPVRATPHAYFSPEVLANAFAKGHTITYEDREDIPPLAARHQDPVRYGARHHYMRYDLLPGSRVLLRPQPDERYFHLRLPSYASGTMKWRCLPSAFAPGADPGVLLQNALAVVESGSDSVTFRRLNPGRPASVVIPFASPYLIVGGRIVGKIGAVENPAFHVLLFNPNLLAGQESWIPLDGISANLGVSLDPLFGSIAHFGYALRIDIPFTGVTLRDFQVLTYLQCAPKALPHLLPGENRFVRYSPAALASQPQPEGQSNVFSVRFEDGLRVGFMPPPPEAEPVAKGR